MRKRLALMLVTLSITLPACVGGGLSPLNVWGDLNLSALQLYSQGRYQESAKAANQALEFAEKTWGPNDLKVADTLILLASNEGLLL